MGADVGVLRARGIGRGDRIGVAEGLGMVADAGDRLQPPPAHEQAQVVGDLAAAADEGGAQPLDARLQRQRIVHRLDRVLTELGLGQPRVVDAHLGEHRRPGIVAAKLAHLPLPRQHPQAVPDLGAQASSKASVRGRPSTRFHWVTLGMGMAASSRRRLLRIASSTIGGVLM